jgi:hypothetical protein
MLWFRRKTRASFAPAPGPSRRRLPVRLLLLVLVAGGLIRPAAAPAQHCPSGNLLAGRMPIEWRDIRGNRAQVTDGKVGPDGALWNAPVAVVLDTSAAILTYDLGSVTPVQAVYVQADANDVYHLWGSVDGKEFRSLAQVEPVEGVHGLRPRKLNLGGAPVRFLRFGEGEGDSSYSVSELQAFCQLPDPFPPRLTVVDAPPATVAKNIYSYWNNDMSSRWELLLALLGLGLLYLDFESRRRAESKEGKRELVSKKVRDRALMFLGVISFFTYFNFGFFHFPNWIHDWEWTHYYIGSKYFKELSYDRLYECIAVADHESPDSALRRRVEKRKLTNLRTNALETTQEVLANPQACKQHFSDTRWEAFKQDVKFFRDRQGVKRWDDLQTDHGYNGTPVWNIAGSVLANLAPASNGQLYTLALLDPLYLIAMVGVVWWAFGWRVTCVGLLVFATNFPSRYYWTGGSFLRWDWIFYLVAAICCLKKDRPLLAGVAIGYATLLRVFPGFVLVGPALAAGYQLVKERTLDRRYLRLALGGLLSIAVLVPLSLQVGGGTQAYVRFYENTAKHKETPLTNYMGMRTLMAYRPGEAGRDLRSDRYTDPWVKWKQARITAWKDARPFYAVVTLGILVLMGWAVRNRPVWQTAALGATFIAVGVELTCYYYAFVIAVALLHDVDERVGRRLLLMTAITGFIDWRPVPGMPGWLDEQYTWMSLVTIVTFLLIIWDMGLGPWLADRRAAAIAAAEAAEAAKGGAPAAKVAVAASASEDEAGEDQARPRRSGNNRQKRR